MPSRSAVTFAALTALLVGLGYSSAARADDAAPAAPAAWWDSFKVSGYLDGGITANPDDPHNGINYGNLYGDRANLPMLNQASVILTRPLDPKATGYDFGFTFQPMYGTDARYTHFFNEFDRSINSRYQFDIVEADGLAHVPFPTEGGMDIKLGQYPTPIGYEVINPTGNPFYSHSYIYEFGIPIKHTGILTTSHITPLLDVYLGADFGNLSQFGKKGDNNEAGAGIGGFGLNMMDGNLTVLALTHIGPENSDISVPRIPNVNGINRYFNDVVVTWKVNDTLTLTTEVNYVKDDLTIGKVTSQEGYGAAQYASYALNDQFTLQARGEVWRDANGFYVAAFPGNFDFTDAGRGIANTSYNGGKATYEEVTLGVNFKPAGVPKIFDGLMLRPEIRYDHADQAKPFNDLHSDHQVTLATDLIVPF